MAEDKDNLTNEDRHMLEKYLYWTVDEVACYNKAIDDALSEVRKQYVNTHLVDESVLNSLVDNIESLKKK